MIELNQESCNWKCLNWCLFQRVKFINFHTHSLQMFACFASKARKTMSINFSSHIPFDSPLKIKRVIVFRVFLIREAGLDLLTSRIEVQKTEGLCSFKTGVELK